MRSAIFLLLTGCAAPAVRVHVHTDDPAGFDTAPLLEEAGAILGVELQPDSYAPIVVEFVDNTGAYSGRYFKLAPCSVFVRSRYNAIIFAHELGHALGLEHVENEGNLMAPRPTEGDLTDRQERMIERGARSLAVCP